MGETWREVRDVKAEVLRRWMSQGEVDEAWESEAREGEGEAR